MSLGDDVTDAPVIDEQAADDNALRVKKLAMFGGGVLMSSYVAARMVGGYRNLPRHLDVVAVSLVLGVAAGYVGIKTLLR